MFRELHYNQLLNVTTLTLAHLVIKTVTACLVLLAMIMHSVMICIIIPLFALYHHIA